MKNQQKKNVLSFIAILFVMTMLVGCKEPNKPTPTPTPTPTKVKVTVTFVFEGANVKDYSFQSDKNKSYTDKELLDMVIPTDASLKEYEAKTPTKEKKVGTTDEKFKVELAKQVVGLTFNIEEVSNDGIECSVKVTPSNGESFYYVDMISKYLAEKKWGGVNGLYDMDVKWWNFLAENNGNDWKDVMAERVYSGEKTFHSRDNLHKKMLYWDHDYYVYYYGIDKATGNQTTATQVMNLHTKKPTPSDNQFNFTMNQIYKDGVDANITTTNNDPYIILCDRKRYVDQFVNKTDTLGVPAMDYMIFELLDDTNTQIYNGNTHITRETLNPRRPNHDYYIIIAGFKNGLTTEVKLIPFKTAPN